MMLTDQVLPIREKPIYPAYQPLNPSEGILSHNWGASDRLYLREITGYPRGKKS